jgi:hypothetical protein
MKRTLARWNPELHMVHSPILRYGFSVASVAIALVLAFTFAPSGYTSRVRRVPIF